MSVRACILASVLLAACATVPKARPLPPPRAPASLEGQIQLASAPGIPMTETQRWALIRRSDLDIARGLLIRARGDLEPAQWELLDRKLAEAERAWERFERAWVPPGKVAQIPRAAPEIGLVGALEEAAPLVEARLLVYLAALAPAEVANGAMPEWTTAELGLAGKLRDVAEASRQVRAEIEAKNRRERRGYVVRLQAQGEGVEESIVLAGPSPITIAEGVRGLELLKGKLPKNELRIREDLFRRAERFIRSSPALGIGPPGRSFALDQSDVRVDVEIKMGTNFQR